MNVLIIGSTGFIGKEVVKQLADKDINLTLLVRNKEKAKHLQKLNKSKIQLITGDLTLPNLGLSFKDKEIALSCNSIIHCGGPMDITLTKEDAKTAFLNGAKHVADLAKEIHKKNGIKKFIHIVGYMSPFSDNPNNWLDFNVFEETHPLLLNDSYYEQMKFQADILIRQITLEENIPLIVINPPTVIGNKDTGETEQLAGFGLFMKIIRKGLLPIIPGGEDYRLPVIHRDVLANFIVDSLLKPVNESATYTLVQNKNEDIKLPELMSIVSNTMNMKAPKLVVPMPLLKTVLTLGGSRVTGVSKSSLNFMTKRQFNNHQVTTDFPATLVKNLSAKESLPLVIADIDYTLTFGNRETAPFTRKSINQTCFYSLNGLGKTIVLVHGLLSEAFDLFSLGIELNKKTGRPILIVDLPGFGRSPFKSDKNILNPYLDVIKIIQQETGSEATFIGHSFGASLLLYAYENKILLPNQQLVLLQPPVPKIATNLPLWINRIVLKAASTKQLSKHFIKQGLFSVEEEIPDTYFQNLNKSFNSPRILNTNLLLNNKLQELTFNLSLSENIYSIWGTEDKSYIKPNNFNVITTLFSGYHFPISQPLKTAKVIEELL